MASSFPTLINDVMDHFSKVKVEYMAMQKLTNELQEKLKKKDKIIKNLIAINEKSELKTAEQQKQLSKQESENLRLNQTLIEQSVLIEENKKQVRSLRQQIKSLKQNHFHADNTENVKRRKIQGKTEISFSHPSFEEVVNNNNNNNKEKKSNLCWPNIQFLTKAESSSGDKLGKMKKQSRTNSKRKLYSEQESEDGILIAL